MQAKAIAEAHDIENTKARALADELRAQVEAAAERAAANEAQRTEDQAAHEARLNELQTSEKTNVREAVTRLLQLVYFSRVRHLSQRSAQSRLPLYLCKTLALHGEGKKAGSESGSFSSWHFLIKFESLLYALAHDAKQGLGKPYRGMACI